MAERMHGTMRIDIPIVIGEVVEARVPEYLLGSNGPLAIRLDPSESKIQIWTWDHRKLVRGLFLMLGDNATFRFGIDGIRLRRHFGTVFGLFKKRYGIRGNAIHLYSLYKDELV